MCGTCSGRTGNAPCRDLEDGGDGGEEPCAALALRDHELADALVARRGRSEATGPPAQLPPDGGRRTEGDDPTHTRPPAGVDRRGKLHPINVPREVCRVSPCSVFDLCLCAAGIASSRSASSLFPTSFACLRFPRQPRRQICSASPSEDDGRAAPISLV